MAENILAWRDARWEGKRVGAILRGKAFAGPGNGFVGVVAGLVDFYPEGPVLPEKEEQGPEQEARFLGGVFIWVPSVD